MSSADHEYIYVGYLISYSHKHLCADQLKTAIPPPPQKKKKLTKSNNVNRQVQAPLINSETRQRLFNEGTEYISATKTRVLMTVNILNCSVSVSYL